MKSVQVNKLYGKLTPQEQATLVFEAASRLDEKEVDAILEKVERQACLSFHRDYLHRTHGLQALVSLYGINYWKTRALLLTAGNLAKDGDAEAKSNVMRFFDQAMAMEAALFEICKELKVDVGAIKTMVGCPEDSTKASELPKVDEELMKQYLELFTQAVMPN